MVKRYKLIDHTADLGMDFFGATVEELFICAAEGLFDIICNKENVVSREAYDIDVDGMDIEDLMVCWLRELIYMHHSKSLLLNRFEISKISERDLKGRAYGEEFDEKRHRIKNEVKAATYHDLAVKKTGGLWMARVIFDV